MLFMFYSSLVLGEEDINPPVFLVFGRKDKLFHQYAYILNEKLPSIAVSKNEKAKGSQQYPLAFHPSY